MELTGNALEDVKEPINELIDSFDSVPVIDFGFFSITQYTFWLVIILAIVLIVVLIAAKKVKLIPQSRFVGMVEYGYDAIRRNMGEGVIGHGFEKHMPFLATLFFFILIANIVGLIPGAKTPTGSLSVTWALAIISFVYFNFWGIKVKGGLGYIKSIAPSGLMKPMVPVIWVFEFISLVLRALTLAVRLYGNMFAGHMILGIFAILTQVFLAEVFAASASAILALPAIAWFLFLVVMYALECLVAFLQAYVFTILSAVYVGLATSNH
jgi:F-type H+-transporting ATPase subunit a